jgi:Leucine-rich repeat (LRR) protein
MQPLTSEESERLFHRRIEHPFGREPEFEKVTEDILKKCGGVPLAIITIASVLAGDGQIKPINEWYELLGSVGCGLTEASGVKEMHMILSYSYYDLPPHLKSCLLYLSIFPEDHKIDKDQLIWRWIAEGFICEETVTRLFEVGEGYYNNLINKGLIQPVFEGVFVGTAEACRVHDMVLDLICFLTRKDNLVTIRNVTEDNMSSQKIARRLSLQKEDHGSASSMSVSQVRSITVFPSAVNIMPPLSSFDVLRVLDLSRCRLATNSLLGVGNLSQLRYLSLEATGIRELPLEIGRLQALRVLDISRNYGLYELPCFVCKITTLMCLVMGYLDVEVPDGFGDLISLEVVKQMEGSRDTIKELFNLTRLRELNIRVKNLGSEMEEAFVEHLGKLKKFQCLWLTGRFASMDLFGERWEPTHHLRMLLLEGRLSALPGWIKRNPMLYSNLSCLHLKLNGLQQEDMRVLGRLPALGELYLNSIDQAPLIYIDSFPQMVFFNLRCSAPGQILCHPGALPRAEIVKFSSVIPMGWFRAADFDFGLRYLLCLRKVVVTVIYSATVCYADKVSAHAALKKAVGTHPNHPLFDLGFGNNTHPTPCN